LLEKQLVVVTGATGYVGARLVPRLLEAGYRVRACGRSLVKLSSRPWAKHEDVELVKVDVFDKESLKIALAGAFAAFYFVHSMNSDNKDFAAADRVAADNMVEAAASTGLKRIIYLGGLGEDSPDLSKHLRSRAEVATILEAGPVPVTVLRAGMILGSGSTSFEILRYLVERLPVMITPRWVSTPSQPIAVRNVLYYLIECLRVDATTGRSFDIGGPEVLTYKDLMQVYSVEAGLGKRWIFPVPVFTPTISSYWIHFVTPVPAYIARPLAEGLRNPVVCKNNDILALIPQPLLDCRTAIAIALECIDQHRVESRWTDAGELPIVPAEWPSPGDPDWAGGTVYEDNRVIKVSDSPAQVWYRLVRLGGKTGWYYGNWLWKLRGYMDRIIGGVGLNRGRRNELELLPGDALDFWRVVDVENERSLLLVAEMKLPGKAFLQFSITNNGDGVTVVQQNARFQPQGLLGLLYWWAVTPLHEFVFNGMLRGIAAGIDGKILEGPSRVTKVKAS
jgi:uncharacterized protein YbjT (DUF2867 family)